MVDFASAESEQDFIQSIREIFRAYVPESDAWAQPNFFSVNATIVGGLAWSAVNEARRGFDVRVNPQTAEGEYLDLIAATPPLDLTRRPATVATGMLAVTGWPDPSIPAGTIFQTAAGIRFTTDATVNVGGNYAIVDVSSVLSGAANNSFSGQPLASGAVQAVSLGVVGAYDAESDDQLRARIYAEQTKYAFFGSACSYERMILAVPGVSRAWAIEDGGVARIVFLMEDKYPCGSPLPEDVAAVMEYFDDPCLTPLFFCPAIGPACSKSIDLVINWTVAPDDICAIEAAFEAWLRETYEIGEGVRGCDIDAWLQDSFPEYGGRIDCCEDFPALSCCVYNCANLTPSCENEVGAPFLLNNWTSAAILAPGECFDGDLAAVNPGLPPGAFEFGALISRAPNGINVPTITVNPDGSFTVCNSEPEDGDALTEWTFSFEYHTLGAVGQGEAINSQGGEIELFDFLDLAPLEPGDSYAGNLRTSNPDVPVTPGFLLVNNPNAGDLIVIVNPNGSFTVENVSEVTYSEWDFTFKYQTLSVESNTATASGITVQPWSSSGVILPGAFFNGNLSDNNPNLPVGVYEFVDVTGYDFSTPDGEGPGELTLNPDGSFTVENVGNTIYDWSFTFQYVWEGGAKRSGIIDATHVTPN